MIGVVIARRQTASCLAAGYAISVLSAPIGRRLLRCAQDDNYEGQCVSPNGVFTSMPNDKERVSENLTALPVRGYRIWCGSESVSPDGDHDARVVGRFLPFVVP